MLSWHLQQLLELFFFRKNAKKSSFCVYANAHVLYKMPMHQALISNFARELANGGKSVHVFFPYIFVFVTKIGKIQFLHRYKFSSAAYTI